jgi:uncharacterized membrane protein
MDIDLDKEIRLEQKKKNILFQILKYIVASSPISIPFILSMIVTGYDLVLSSIITLVFCIVLVIIIAITAKKEGKLK